MILKKPYAFLIKYFKLIHGILLVIMSYLLYRTNILFNFFQEYLNTETVITGRDFTGQLFNSAMFILPFVVIAVLLILLIVMYRKKKPLVFYLLNLTIMISIIILYNLGSNVTDTLSTQLIETRVLRFYRDTFVILAIIQGLGVILTFIRATGFDIKKFDFVTDLHELDITDEDAEEFEVDVDIEANVLKRNVNRYFRNAKYFYLEHKFIINMLSLLAFSGICLLIYLNLTIYNKVYKEQEIFKATEFSMGISDSYLTQYDNKGQILTDNYLLIVKLNLKANYDEKIAFNKSKVKLIINKQIYLPIDNYKTSFLDLGHYYNNSKISYENFQSELIVFEIPANLISKRMVFRYTDATEIRGKKIIDKNINVRLSPENIDEKETNHIVKLNEANEINQEILKDTTVYLTSLDIKDKFKVEYNFCLDNKCQKSFEYLLPNTNTNYDKALLKVNGTATIASQLENSNITNLYSLIRIFGKLKYVINGSTKYYSNLSQVSTKKTDLTDIYYLEIPREVLSAEKISFVFDVRSEIYEYVIK